MNMWQLSTQQKAKIVGVSPKLSPEQKNRLEDLGFALQEIVVCIKKIPFGGPAVFQVQSSLFAVEKAIASHVLVEVI